MSDEKRDDGGQAFPIASPLKNRDGMSLRDYFAAKALSSAYASDGTDIDDAIMARRCYELADAMLEARKK